MAAPQISHTIVSEKKTSPRDTGRPSDELVEDAVIGYFDELAHTREMLDRRYDDLDSGRVNPIDGEEAYRRLMERTEAPGSVVELPLSSQ